MDTESLELRRIASRDELRPNEVYVEATEEEATSIKKTKERFEQMATSIKTKGS